jgi:hypothetical protein
MLGTWSGKVAAIHPSSNEHGYAVTPRMIATDLNIPILETPRLILRDPQASAG